MENSEEPKESLILQMEQKNTKIKLRAVTPP
jgi:hypothetical protein